MQYTVDNPLLAHVPYLGFRQFISNRDQYGDKLVMLDTPLEGKCDPMLMSCGEPQGQGWGMVDTTHLAGVPLPGSGELLGAVMVTVLLVSALLKFANLDESIRGVDSGRP